MTTSWLLLTHELSPEQGGGVGAWADDLAHALAHSGQRIDVLAPATRGSSVAGRAALARDRMRAYTVHRVAGRSWRSMAGLWLGMRAASMLKPHGAVVCATWRLALPIAALCEARGVPLLVAAHGSDLTTLRTAPASLRAVDRRAVWLPVSRFLGQELDRLDLRGPQVQLPMALDIPTTVPDTPRPGLVCVARPTPLKGIDRAVRLAHALKLPLDLIGPTERPPGHRPPGLRVHGRLARAQVMDLLTRRTAVVLLPRSSPEGMAQEGFGLSILEAAARQTPAIGCATGGVPEAVGPGLILPNPDRPNLADVQAFLADPLAGERALHALRAHHGAARALVALHVARGLAR